MSYSTLNKKQIIKKFNEKTYIKQDLNEHWQKLKKISVIILLQLSYAYYVRLTSLQIVTRFTFPSISSSFLLLLHFVFFFVLHHDGGWRLLIGWSLAKPRFRFAAVQLHVDERDVVAVYCDVTSAEVGVLDVVDSGASPVNYFLNFEKIKLLLFYSYHFVL